jgi:hypothetical protein
VQKLDLNSQAFQQRVAELQQRTIFDEEVIGCFLCNYGDPRICGAFKGPGCKDAARCQSLAKTTGQFDPMVRTTT